MPDREKLVWEDMIRRVYRHEMRRRTHEPYKWHLRISNELAMEIQASKNWGVNINIGMQLTTWQGIPMIVDHDLPPGCFRFEEGERNE